jgi:hypothetical protein
VLLLNLPATSEEVLRRITEQSGTDSIPSPSANGLAHEGEIPEKLPLS